MLNREEEWLDRYLYASKKFSLVSHKQTIFAEVEFLIGRLACSMLIATEGLEATSAV